MCPCQINGKTRWYVRNMVTETGEALHSNQDECDRSSEMKRHHMYFKSSTLCKQTPFLKSIDVSIVFFLDFWGLATIFLLILSHIPPSSQKICS